MDYEDDLHLAGGDASLAAGLRAQCALLPVDVDAYGPAPSLGLNLSPYQSRVKQPVNPLGAAAIVAPINVEEVPADEHSTPNGDAVMTNEGEGTPASVFGTDGVEVVQ